MFFWSSWSKQGFKGPRTSLYSKNYQHRSILGYSGDHLGMIRACSGWFPGMFELGKIDLHKFSKNQFFEDRCTVCSLKAQGPWSGSGPKVNFDKMSVPAWPALTGLVVSRQPLYVARRGPELLSAVAGPMYTLQWLCDDGNTCWTWFLHETAFPLSYSHEN